MTVEVEATEPPRLTTVAALALLLSRCRFRSSNEDDLQRAIAEILDHGPATCLYRREVRLTPRDRIDFLVEASTFSTGDGVASHDGVGIEVKVNGTADSLIRQLTRYAEHDDIAALLVVTTQRRHALALPDEIEGKPLRVAYVGGTGL